VIAILNKILALWANVTDAATIAIIVNPKSLCCSWNCNHGPFLKNMWGWWWKIHSKNCVCSLNRFSHPFIPLGRPRKKFKAVDCNNGASGANPHWLQFAFNTSSICGFWLLQSSIEHISNLKVTENISIASLVKSVDCHHDFTIGVTHLVTSEFLLCVAYAYALWLCVLQLWTK